MRLFDVPAQTRVRVVSKVIRWVERGSEQIVGQELTWEGTTTDSYYYFKGCRRRLLINHTIGVNEFGIWQADVECEIIK